MAIVRGIIIDRTGYLHNGASACRAFNQNKSHRRALNGSTNVINGILELARSQRERMTYNCREHRTKCRRSCRNATCGSSPTARCPEYSPAYSWRSTTSSRLHRRPLFGHNSADLMSVKISTTFFVN